MPDTVSHMNFFKRYLFKKALLEDELANEERRRKEEMVIAKQPEPEPASAVAAPASIVVESPIEIPQIKKNEASGGKISLKFHII